MYTSLGSNSGNSTDFQNYTHSVILRTKSLLFSVQTLNNNIPIFSSVFPPVTPSNEIFFSSMKNTLTMAIK